MTRDRPAHERALTEILAEVLERYGFPPLSPTYAEAIAEDVIDAMATQGYAFNKSKYVVLSHGSSPLKEGSGSVSGMRLGR